ncbi:MAG: hypothetical protein AAF458_14330 [Pseudomonadota bacterium]
MNRELLDEIVACLPEERTHFHYFADRFALGLLAEHGRAVDGLTTRAARQGRFAALLNKPTVKEALSGCGHARVDPEHLLNWGLERSMAFLLALDHWGHHTEQGWYQTSRPGFNLVLQLNFTASQTRALERLGNGFAGLFNFDIHPVSKPADRRYRETLAWSRIDLDLDTNEALIEEVQSDWVRDVRDALPANGQAQNPWEAAVQTVVDRHFPGVLRWWHEAMLWASIWFIRCELGMRDIYFHDYETGVALKNIRYSRPPRSLYTRLPRRFCMTPSSMGPSFLYRGGRARRVLKRLPNPRFYRLELEEQGNARQCA